MQIIAEVKTQSPFGFKSDKSWDELFEIANHVGDIISIHTSPRWGGSFKLLAKARALTSKPILAKGIHNTDGEIYQALYCGADYVLVVGRLPAVHLLNKCLYEPTCLAELNMFQNFKVVWNSRYLYDGSFKLETIKQAREIHKEWLCQASNIKTKADICEGVDAVLVGEHLPEFSKDILK